MANPVEMPVAYSGSFVTCIPMHLRYKTRLKIPLESAAV
jgi:hypothetical protein